MPTRRRQGPDRASRPDVAAPVVARRARVGVEQAGRAGRVRVLDRQHPALGLGAARRREPAEATAGRDDAMARHDDRHRVAPQRLADRARDASTPTRAATSP